MVIIYSVIYYRHIYLVAITKIFYFSVNFIYIIYNIINKTTYLGYYILVSLIINYIGYYKLYTALI